MSEIRVYRANSFPVSPHVNSIYIIEDDSYIELHYVDAAGNHTLMKPAAVVAAITDNGGGAAADGTIGAITLTEPANLAAQTVINQQLADAVKELSTKLNEVIAGQKTAKLMKSS